MPLDTDITLMQNPFPRQEMYNKPVGKLARGVNKTPQFVQKSSDGTLSYLEHGRRAVGWHCHDEYELHLIVATHGRMFIGTHIAEFSPGSLVLTGPRLPHNWISEEEEEEETTIKHMLVKFSGAPLEAKVNDIPELREILPLFERAACGIEFFNCSSEVKAHLIRIRDTTGLERLTMFLQLLCDLAYAQNYRLLSNPQIRSLRTDIELDRIGTVLDYIMKNHQKHLSAELIAQHIGMSLTKFSVFFQKAVGSTFLDFVNTFRINKACDLLMSTDQYVGNVSHRVGFNNIANFNRWFLRVKGMTPTKFREQESNRFKE